MKKIVFFIMFFLLITGINTLAYAAETNTDQQINELKQVKIIKTQKAFSSARTSVEKAINLLKQKYTEALLIEVIKSFDKMSYFDKSYYLYESFIDLYIKNEIKFKKKIQKNLAPKRAKLMLANILISKREFVKGNDFKK